MDTDAKWSDTPVGWYVSDSHIDRAVGYLSADLAEKGFLPADFESPRLREMFGDALLHTMQDDDRSPVDERSFR